MGLFGFRNSTDYFFDGVCYHKEGKYKKAFSCFQKAADEENSNAIYHVAYYYEHGLGVTQDYSMALYHYNRIAEHDPTAAYKVGYFYEFGLGTYCDEALAVKYYILAYDKAASNDLSECKPPYEALCRLAYKYREAETAILYKKF